METKTLSAISRTILFFVIFVASITKSDTHTEYKAQPEYKLQLSDSKELQQSFNPDKDNAVISYKYVGCSFSKKFHRPRCMFAKAISKQHLVLFQWRRQAIAAHYAPCHYCLPPTWLSTHCAILPTNPKTKSPDNSQSDATTKTQAR